MRQEAAWLVSGVLILAIMLVFIAVARSGQERSDYEGIAGRAARTRRVFGWALVLVVTPIMLYTLRALPYPVSAEAADFQVVSVTGHQWAWEMSTAQVRASAPVEFQVTSADVNHGFAIYDEELRLVAQVQAMPGYLNRLRYSFPKAGKYVILCLEYCGRAHHMMKAELEVTGEAEGGLTSLAGRRP